MDRLKAQENQSEIRTLRKLLQSAPKGTKKEREWQLVENALFAQMDETVASETVASVNYIRLLKPFRKIQRFFPQRIPALGYALSLIVILTVGIFFWQRVHTSDTLKYSRILGQRGEVSFSQSGYSGFDKNKAGITDEDRSTTSDNQPALYKNQVFETGRNATLVVQIDRKSHFILSEMSKLTVRNASLKKIVFFLHKGESMLGKQT
jgi:hypothetical protein